MPSPISIAYRQKLIAEPSFIRMCRSTLIFMVPAWLIMGFGGYVLYSVVKEIGHQAGIY